MPKVSIIVPVYRVEQYLKACLDSALCQTYSDFELILVDDGSPDRCPDICDEYATQDSRIRVIHKKNSGVSDARNAGLDAATGEYIYFLDSDDFMEPDLLETVVEKMDTGMDLVIFKYQSVYEDGSTKDVQFCQQGMMELPNESARKRFITQTLLTYQVGWEPWNRMFRRDKIEAYGLRFVDRKKTIAEDLYFSLCYCAHVSKLFVLDACLYNYRQWRGSFMGENRGKRNLDGYNQLSKAVLDFYWKFDDCEMLVRDFHTIHYMITACKVVDGYRNSGMSWPKYRQAIRSEISDLAFFEEQMTKQLRNPWELKECYPRFQNLEYLIFVCFLLGGSETAMRFRSKLLWNLCDFLDENCWFAGVLEEWIFRQVSRPYRRMT